MEKGNRIRVMMVGALIVAGFAFAGIEKSEGRPQSTCPITGSNISKDVYADYEGKRVYFCCAGCIGNFQKDASANVAKLEGKGIVLEKVSRPLCNGCGEVKGSKKCCVRGAKKCGKCELHKGSPGCCKLGKKEKLEVSNDDIRAVCGTAKKAGNCCGTCGNKPAKCDDVKNCDEDRAKCGIKSKAGNCCGTCGNKPAKCDDVKKGGKSCESKGSKGKDAGWPGAGAGCGGGACPL